MKNRSLPRLCPEKAGPVLSCRGSPKLILDFQLPSPPGLSLGQEQGQETETLTNTLLSFFLLPFEARWLGNQEKSFIHFVCG